MQKAASNPINESATRPEATGTGHSREEFLAHGLLLRIADGDEPSLRELYELWATTLLGIAHRLIGDRFLAEEAVQDAFVRIWHRADRYDPAEGRPFVWAYSILRGICLDRLRRQGRQKRGGKFAFEPVSGGEIDGGGASELIHREVSEQILNGLARLSEEERRCLELYVFQEFTHQEIATECHSPLGTIKTRVRRSLRRLRELIDHHA
jgi:RNA polymerase sigma-70 factor (ECF subfamily)